MLHQLYRFFYPEVTFKEFSSAAFLGGDHNLVTVKDFMAETNPYRHRLNDDSHGHTALYWAAYNGHTAIALTLLDSPHLEIDIEDKQGNTALICAAGEGRLLIIKGLLARITAVYDLEHKNNREIDAEQTAIRKGHPEIANLIRERITQLKKLSNSPEKKAPHSDTDKILTANLRMNLFTQTQNQPAQPLIVNQKVQAARYKR